ncbi:CidA/LrgA family protein [Chitinasiproducens palmae]|nr:CidA/LrgA family protein [Chitinasiproducens palmae]
MPARAGVALQRLALTGAQCGLLAVLWLAADAASRHLALPIPGSVLGLAILLTLLFTGRVAPRWFKAGADWLLAELLLFFVPAAVAVVQYGHLLRDDGLRLAAVVVAGTLLVMCVTACAVDLGVRLERKLVRQAAQRRAARRR